MTIASEIFAGLLPHEQRAVNMLKAMLDAHNSVDGIGPIATGAGRYTVFEGRVRLMAIRARTVRQWWGLMARELRLGSTPKMLDSRILDLLSGDDDGAVLGILAEPAAVVMIARSLHTEDKQTRKQVEREFQGDQPPASFDTEMNDQLPF